MPSKAQETIELTFTANAQGGIYCPFDAVNVTNVTRGWTATLAYPDTVLVLNSTVGIDEQHYEEAIHLGEAYPNPFTDETNIPLDMPFTGEVSIQVVRIDGTVVATSRNHLEAGSYRMKVSLSSPAMAFLVATSTQGRQVVRMLCTKSGGRDSITLEPVSREYKPSIQLVRGSTSGEFQPGDMMRYTSVLFDGANTVYSNTITQPQYESEIITMLFDLTLPEVITSQVTNITQNTATGGGNVTATGGVSVTERGICWSTSHNPTISSSHASNGLGAGSYTVQMSGLTAGTTYFVRAYAINRFGTAYGNEVSFTTTQIPSYTISVSANPTNGGTVSGGGSYQQGQSCTVIATAANGYSFNNWTENGSVVSTNPNYSFTVNNNRSLVANFSVQAPNTYTINASPNPSDGGVVTGGGTYQQGQSCTVSATANTGYTFLRWTENGNQVSSNANYTFTVTGNRTLVAQFQLQSFTISATVTPSNSGTVTGGGSYNYGQLCTLMATANTGYVFEKWTKNGTQVSTEATYSFTVTESASYVAHFQLQDYTINVSANPANGGNVTGGGSYSFGQSCTVTATANTGYTFLRWTENGNQVSTNASYTFTVTGNRFLVAQFQEQSYTITASANPTNGGSVTGGGTYQQGQSCTVSATAATGYIFNNWTENGYQISANANYTFTVTGNRTLVAQFQAQSHTINVSANPTNGGSVSGGGSYNYGQSCTVSATASTGYTFSNWTENGNQVSTNANYTFTVTNNRTLVAQFQNNTAVPTVSTNQVINITQTSATGGGNVTSDGGASVTERGVCWSTSHNPTTAGSHANSGTAGMGPFSVNMTGLTANTTYYVRAYAINSAGTSYGSEVSFTTSNGGGGAHEYVDLGLPSGTLWATCNVGATSPEDYGYFFAWGETTPKTFYDWSNYQYCNGGYVNNGVFIPYLTKYCNNSNYGYNGFTDNLSTLLLVDDAATVNWGSDWRMPTKEECQELFQNTTHIWTTQNGVNGRLFTASNGNSLFLPAAGIRTGNNFTQAGSKGFYWSSSLYNLYEDDPSLSKTLLFASGSCSVSASSRCNGLAVRPVRFSQDCTITVTPSPTAGGTVIGGGIYQVGQTCTVTATAATGYIFNNWTENGIVVSTNANYTFTVSGNRTLVAQFQAISYSINASAYPSEGGSVNGAGTYTYGQTCTLTATANNGYTFVNWTEGGEQLSTIASYSFMVTGNRTLVANFEEGYPVGAINGLFSVSATQQVYFSQGNLQYQASSNTWRFATNQYDYIGTDNNYISQTNNGWIDLFGWGTSGYNHGAVCYQPWSTSYNSGDYYAYGSYNYNLYDQTGQADWGYNAISNGGNQTNQWRTLTTDEWRYVFNFRTTSSGRRYAKANVNNVNGVILLPDNWSTSTYSLSNTNQSSASYSSNTISVSQWSILEDAGAVFLPAAGDRQGDYVSNVGSGGYYWSASYDTYNGEVYHMWFNGSYFELYGWSNRGDGHSVRLVRSVQ